MTDDNGDFVRGTPVKAERDRAQPGRIVVGLIMIGLDTPAMARAGNGE